MNDLLRSIILLTGLAAGVAAGWVAGGCGGPAGKKSAAIAGNAGSGGGEGRFSNASRCAAAEMPNEPAERSGGLLLDRIASWYERALAARPGDGEALVLEVEREMGSIYLNTLCVHLAETDPEGCLRGLIKLWKLNREPPFTRLFKSWRLVDPAAAGRAVASLPTACLRNSARQAFAALQEELDFQSEQEARKNDSWRQMVKRQAPKTLEPEPKAPPKPGRDFSVMADAVMAMKGGTDKDFILLESMPDADLVEKGDWWVGRAMSFNPGRAAKLLKRLGPAGLVLLENYANRAPAGSPGMPLERIDSMASTPEDNARVDRKIRLKQEWEANQNNTATARKVLEQSRPGDFGISEFRHVMREQATEDFHWAASLPHPAARQVLLEEFSKHKEGTSLELLAGMPTGEARDACVRRYAVEHASESWLRALSAADYDTAAAAIRADFSQPHTLHARSLKLLESLEQ